MSIETSDMLLFVYINSRSLRHAGNPLDKYKKKKNQKQLDKEVELELNDQLLNWEDDIMTVEVDEEDDLNWSFINNLINTDPDPLDTINNYMGPDPLSFMEEGIIDPEFTPEEIIESNLWFGNNPGALDYDMEDIYDA
jgi:hypothetical protein